MKTDKPLVIISGSNGFIGEALSRALSIDFNIVGLDREIAPSSTQDNYIKTDISSQESVNNALSQVQKKFGKVVNSVIHLAAYYDFSGKPSPNYDKITVQGTEHLINSLHETFTEIGQFIFSSTMLVHAPCMPGQRINEDWPLEAKWDYPQSKLNTEKLILEKRGKIPIVFFRIAGVYNDQCHCLPLANQIQRIYERRITSHVFPGDTLTGQAFIHLEDLIAAIQTALEQQANLPAESTFLIGEEETISYDELQRMFAWLIHAEGDWNTTSVPKIVAKAGAWIQDVIPGIEEPFIKPWMIDLADDHYELDITRAKKLLRWKPRKTLREILPKMVLALKTNPTYFYQQNKLELPSTEKIANHEDRSF